MRVSVAYEKFRTAVFSIDERQTDGQISRSPGFKSSIFFFLQESTGQNVLLQAPAIMFFQKRKKGHAVANHTPRNPPVF